MMTTPDRSSAAAFPRYLTGEVVADSVALHAVDIEELGHVELAIGAIGGYQLVNGEHAPLPIGSSLERGVFYWQPGPGFLGMYDLFLEREDGTQARVRVNIRAKSY